MLLSNQFETIVWTQFFFDIFIEFILFTDFEKKKGEIPPVLEQYLKTIAKTGETL